MSAVDLKQKGNAEFSAGNFVQAIQYFSDAIVLEPVNEVLYCNRSMAHASLENWEQSATDAKTVRQTSYICVRVWMMTCSGCATSA